MSEDIYKLFGKQLFHWHKTLDRPLPWKGIKDPYLIWVSEIILQQTRAAQATPYFHKITTRFPNVQTLAKAHVDELLALWQGLGYYSRARNLHFSAKLIVDSFGGIFPNKYEDILSLKGVGKYTAAAIGSFAFNLPYPVVDGNVIRIVSRYFDLDEAVDSADGIKKVNQFVDLVFDEKKPANFNQAIMDFGATVCIPKNPLCETCPFGNNCQAFHKGTVKQRPIKIKKLKRKVRHFNFLWFEKGSKILIQKRKEKDIWQGLHQLPVVEGIEYATARKLKKASLELFGFSHDLLPVFTYKQLLTHQEIHSIVWQVSGIPDRFNVGDTKWVEKKKLIDYGFPKTLTVFFEDYLYIRKLNQS